VTHVLDFGPGGGPRGDGVGGSAGFTAWFKEGAGVQVLLARAATAAFADIERPHMAGLSAVLSPDPPTMVSNWSVHVGRDTGPLAAFRQRD
jgi:hypothetical protein